MGSLSWTDLGWLLAALAGVVGCGLCAGLETGLYSLNRVRLHLLASRGHAGASVIAGLLANPNRILAALLIGTNLATNLCSSGLGVVLEKQGLSELQIILVEVAIVTPTLFILAETLPKDLFAAHADRLVYPFALLLEFICRLFTWIGLLPLIMGVSTVLLRLFGTQGPVRPFHPRRLVESLVKEGVGYGLISDEQSALAERVLDVGRVTVRQAMVPWGNVTYLRVDDGPQALWRIADRTSFSRLPVLDEAGRVAGMLSVTDALLHEKAACPPVRSLLTPLMSVRGNLPVRAALRILQAQRAAMAVVTDEYDQPIGIVTAKDLVEPITGELTGW